MNARAAALLRMTWHDCAFAHWRADGELLARSLPDGAVLDRFAGEAWLSVVPFRMTGIRPTFGPVLPGFSAVAEINLRTYVRVGGEPGVWFFSLDAASPLLVEAARITTGLPYFRARIDTAEHARRIRYASVRTDNRGPAGRFRAQYDVPRGAQPAEPETLSAFLHERYRFFTLRGRRLSGGAITHAPWLLGELHIDIMENTLGDQIAHPLTRQPDCAFFARIAQVRAAPLRLAGRS